MGVGTGSHRGGRSWPCAFLDSHAWGCPAPPRWYATGRGSACAPLGALKRVERSRNPSRLIGQCPNPPFPDRAIVFSANTGHWHRHRGGRTLCPSTTNTTREMTSTLVGRRSAADITRSADATLGSQARQRQGANVAWLLPRTALRLFAKRWLPRSAASGSRSRPDRGARVVSRVCVGVFVPRAAGGIFDSWMQRGCDSQVAVV